MSKKSKHGRGKHPHKIKRPMQPGTSASATQPVSGDISRASAPVAAAPVQQAQVQVQRKQPLSAAALPLNYAFITGELKQIGILTGIVVVVLVVLYIFLR
jgi:hypothetical protein